jgi:RNA recognition motif-containing protein
VTNLSDETTENDLMEIFRDFLPQRVYLVRDKENNTSRGFAFVTFAIRRYACRCIFFPFFIYLFFCRGSAVVCNSLTPSVAQAAMNAKNELRWDHLILSVEWARPSIK